MSALRQHLNSKFIGISNEEEAIMKCLAIGDMFIPARYFDENLQNCGLFEGYESLSWKEEQDKKAARDTIRQIETLGFKAYPTTDEMLDKIKDVDVLAIHLCPVPSEMIKAAKNLKYILTCRGGVENIDVDAAKEKGITIINCPGHNAYAVAEMTIGLILCEMRNIARANKALVQGVWREKYPNSEKIIELRSSKIGIIGFGTIGRLVAERLKVFGAQILVNDPYVDAEEIESMGYTSMDKEQLLAEADVVTLHGRIAVGDPPIVGSEELKKMKKSAYLINTARAVLVDMEALYEAMENEVIRGAAIDVYPVEPLPKDYKFFKLDNITLTNHRGGATIESYLRAPEMLLEQFQELLDTGKTRCMIQ